MPNFPLSPSRKAGNTLYVSGQIGAVDGVLVSDDIGEQLRQAVRNLEDVLKQASMTLENVVDVAAFLVDQDDYIQFNEVYTKCFKEPYPARATVTVTSLPLNAKVELKVIASQNL